MMTAVGGMMSDGKRILEDPAAAVSPTKKTNTGEKNGYWCEICQLKCKGDETSINNHNAGTKHVKKEAGQLMLLKLTQEYDCFETDPESGKLRCVICNIEATSPQLLEAHFNGLKHKSKMQGAAANGNAGAPAAKAETKQAPVVRQESGAAASDGQTEASSNGFWCEICKLRGNSSSMLIETHMAGNKHKKRQASYELLQKLRQQDDCFVQDAVSGVLKCLVCTLEMATPQQLEAHLSGAKHRSKAQGATATAGSAEAEAVELTTDGYWCQVCKLSGTHTPMSVQAHMQGAKHLRKVAGELLLQKLKENFTCFDHDEVTGMLTCKVCKIEVNTPQLLEIHLGGTKHKLRVEGKPMKRKHDGDPNHTPAKRVAPNPEDAERTVFLKNMSFKSTEEEIRAVFEDCGEIESLFCIKDFKGRNKGFGYLMFKEKESAVKALEKDKTVLEERPMYVSAYNPEERKDHNRNREPEKDKLFVSGLPQTMTEEEIRTLFEPHGEIKDLRMLMKKDLFKGLCYLDYADEETAAAVKEATDQFEIGPNKITVLFSYPPRPHKGFHNKRRFHKKNVGDANASATEGGEEGTNNIDAAAEVPVAVAEAGLEEPSQDYIPQENYDDSFAEAGSDEAQQAQTPGRRGRGRGGRGRGRK